MHTKALVVMASLRLGFLMVNVNVQGYISSASERAKQSRVIWSCRSPSTFAALNAQ